MDLRIVSEEGDLGLFHNNAAVLLTWHAMIIKASLLELQITALQIHS